MGMAYVEAYDHKTSLALLEKSTFAVSSKINCKMADQTYMLY